MTGAGGGGGGNSDDVSGNDAVGGGDGHEMRAGGRKNSVKVRLLYQVLSQRGMMYVHTKNQKVGE